MTQSDDGKISEDRREALRYALAIGSGAALTSALAVTPASAQAGSDNTLDNIRVAKTLRIAVLPGELPYFNKDLAAGTWSGMCIDMASDIAKLLDVKLEYTESTYGNSILDLQSNKVDLGFALNPTPQRALVVDFTHPVFPHPFGAMLRKGLEAKTWADINKPEVKIAVDVGSANETVARRFAPNATINSLKSRDEVMLRDVVRPRRLRGQRAGAGADRDRQEPEPRHLQDPADRPRSPFPAPWRCAARPTSAGAISSRCGSTTTAASARCANGSSRACRSSGVKPEDVPVELNI